MAKRKRAGNTRGRAPKKRTKGITVNYKSILDDRVSFLENTTAKIVPAANKRAAEQLQRQAKRELGVTYDVQSRKVNGKTQYRLKRRKVGRTDVRDASETKRIIDALHSKSKAARGRKAKALEQLGRREAFWDFAVGDTNES